MRTSRAVDFDVLGHHMALKVLRLLNMLRLTAAAALTRSRLYAAAPISAIRDVSASHASRCSNFGAFAPRSSSTRFTTCA
jgi:hypothetical protein